MNCKKELPKELFLALLAGCISALNINIFVNSGGIIPGGFSGISVFLTRIFSEYLHMEVPYGVFYMAFNIPAALLVFKAISKRFTLVSLVEIITSSVMVSIFPKINITSDLLLAAVFGGICNGIANGTILSANACSGGTDFIAIFFAKKKHKSVWNEVFMFNVCILTASAFFFGLETVLYSIIYQFASTQMTSFADKRYKRSYFIIISDKADEISQAVYNQFHHTVTILNGVGGYTKTERTVLYTICGEYETNQLTSAILSIDPKAFVNISSTKRVVGNFHEMPY